MNMDIISFTLILCSSMNVPFIVGFDLNHRVEYDLGGVDIFNEQWSKNEVHSDDPSANQSSKIDRCVAVEAAKELGCSFRSQTNLFAGLFGPICEQHQLCYTCGSLWNIESQTCNQLANMHMYKQCMTNIPAGTMRYTCLRERFPALKWLREHVYHIAEFHPDLRFECEQKCVLDYIYSDSF